MAADSIYEQMAADCCSNSVNFKYNLWGQAYQQGLANALEILMLSPDAVSTNLKTKELSQLVFNIFNQSEITQVLSGCMSENEHFAFIRNLLITEAAG